MKDKTGGPAFPRTFLAFAASAGDAPVELTVPEPGPPGMTLRQYYAAHAVLHGKELSWPDDETERMYMDRIAGLKLAIADATLRLEEKQTCRATTPPA